MAAKRYVIFQMNHGKKYVDLIHELQNMPEHILVQKIKLLGNSIEIFRGNYNELTHYLKIHNNPELSMALLFDNDRTRIRAFQIEITRFLHNYLASAMSLVDHTRIHTKDLYGVRQIFPEYQKEINERFINNPLSSFIKDFRNYIQHFKLPNLSSTFSFGRDKPTEMKMNVTVSDLNEFSGWKSLSKKFIDSHTKEIDLLQVIEDYHKLVEDFYNWFLNKQNEIHQNEIEKVKEKYREINENAVGQFISEIVSKEKTVEEFEDELKKLISDDNLELIMNSKSKSEKIGNIINLLTKNKYWDYKAVKKIKKIYS